MALATLYLWLLTFKFAGSNWNSDGTTCMFLVNCCCNHLTNFKFSRSNWKSNCTTVTFSKIYLCHRFAAVTCCSNQVTDYSTFQDPRETPMPQQVPFAKLVCLTALLLQPVALITLLATQLFSIQENSNATTGTFCKTCLFNCFATARTSYNDVNNYLSM